MIEGHQYAFFEGEVEMREKLMLFRTQNAIDLGSMVELKIANSNIESVLIH